MGYKSSFIPFFLINDTSTLFNEAWNFDELFTEMQKEQMDFNVGHKTLFMLNLIINMINTKSVRLCLNFSAF